MTKDVKKKEEEEEEEQDGETKSENYKVIVAFETPDNQIDFNFVKIEPLPSLNNTQGSKYTYNFIQYREVTSYQKDFDPIVKFEAVFIK